MDSSVIGEGMSILHCVLSYRLPYALFFFLTECVLSLSNITTFYILFVIKATQMAVYIMEQLMDGIWGHYLCYPMRMDVLLNLVNIFTKQKDEKT